MNKVKKIFMLLLLIIISKKFIVNASTYDTPMPSNYLLVRDTDAIVFAKATHYGLCNKVFNIPDEESSFEEFSFKITHVLKGSIKEKEVFGKGIIGKRDNDEYDFSKTAFRKLGWIDLYEENTNYLLFLSKREYQLSTKVRVTSWIIEGSLTSRYNEEVKDLNSPWVRAVKEYIEISKLNDEALENKKIEEYVQALGQKKRDRYEEALYEDLQSHLDYIEELKYLPYRDKGKILYEKWCGNCHGKTKEQQGAGQNFYKTQIGSFLVFDNKYRNSISAHIQKLINGKDGQEKMPVGKYPMLALYIYVAVSFNDKETMPLAWRNGKYIPYDQDAESIAHGKKVYFGIVNEEINCSVCHGTGDGPLMSDAAHLQNGNWISKKHKKKLKDLTDAEWFASVWEGVDGTAMAGWGVDMDMPAYDTWCVIAYIKNELNKKK